MDEDLEAAPRPFIDRRGFVRVLGVALGAAVGAVSHLRAWTLSPRPWTHRVAPARSLETRRLGMIIDLDRCIGCQACSVSCKVEHGVRLGGFRAWVSEREVGRYPKVTRVFLPRLCNHCEYPACLDVCPTGATFKRDDGLVAIDKSRCIGCRHCMEACPYGVRYFNPSKSPDEGRFPALTHGTVDKCDFCAHRIDRGVVPACVNTCPAGARVFGDLNDPSSPIHRKLADGSARPLLAEFGTQPSVYYQGGEPDAFREV